MHDFLASHMINMITITKVNLLDLPFMENPVRIASQISMWLKSVISGEISEKGGKKKIINDIKYITTTKFFHLIHSQSLPGFYFGLSKRQLIETHMILPEFDRGRGFV